MRNHVVKAGESLSQISKSYRVSLKELLEVNRQIININLIQVGQIIQLPKTAVIEDAQADARASAPSASVEYMLERARSAMNKKTRYVLGAGGMIPATAIPGNLNNACDCSGFVNWCLGISRKTDHPLYVKFNGGWINTDAMVYDAGRATGFFSSLPSPEIGCLIVFPGPPHRKIGHVGIVSEVNGVQVSKVIHCSSSHYRKFGDAIQETSPAAFNRPDTILAWYEGLY